jgi:hypothetical protein
MIDCDLKLVELFALYRLRSINVAELRIRLIDMITESSDDFLFAVSYCREYDEPCLIAAIDALFDDRRLNTLTPKQILSVYAVVVSRYILSGELSLREGADRIAHAAEVTMANAIVEGLDTFLYASSEWPERPEASAILEKGVLDEAKCWASKDIIQFLCP